MKKFLILTLLLALSFAGLQAQKIETHLSDSAFASIITCGAGDEFYTTFGHSAIRICDTTQNLDLVYNYGTFNFDTPHFYWTFACGRLNYHLARGPFQNFIIEYAFEGRAVWEQRLRISNQELNNLFVLLETNYLPEYRYYMYDFFRDNCATRVRDMVQGCLCHRDISPEVTADTNFTYRQFLHQSTETTLLWWRLGIDIALGQRCDHRCSNYQYMFSPIEMMHQFDTMTVSDTHQPLCEPTVQILAEKRAPLSRSISPTLLFWVIFMAVMLLTLLSWRKSWSLKWLDIPIFILPLLVSVLVIFLWFFTNHYCTKPNFNILWASPLFLYFVLRLHKSNRWIVLVQLVMLLGAMVMTLAPLPQQLNVAILPISLILFLRLIAQLRAPVQVKTSSKRK